MLTRTIDQAYSNTGIGTLLFDAEAAVGAGVHPGAGLVGVDVAARVGDGGPESATTPLAGGW
jgi:hypothetical protein